MRDFQVKEEVIYVPNHAHRDTEHPDCENGIVSSAEGTGPSQKVWVKYKGETGQLTPTKNLVRR